jgi:hypothetical protein
LYVYPRYGQIPPLGTKENYSGRRYCNDEWKVCIYNTYLKRSSNLDAFDKITKSEDGGHAV